MGFILSFFLGMETRSRRSQSKTVFVTVGTTKFEKLIQTMCEDDTLKVMVILLPLADQCLPALRMYLLLTDAVVKIRIVINLENLFFLVIFFFLVGLTDSYLEFYVCKFVQGYSVTCMGMIRAWNQTETSEKENLISNPVVIVDIFLIC